MAQALRGSVHGSIETIRMSIDIPFTDLVRLFEQQFARYDFAVGATLIANTASWDEVEDQVGAMIGPHGLTIMTVINQGALATLRGRPDNCRLYLIGNPLIATELVNWDIRAAMLVPFRVALYEQDGVSALSYDLPSSSLGSLANPALAELGRDLDLKIGHAVAAVLKAADAVVA